MAMDTNPYHVIVIPQIVSVPSDEQLTWMVRTCRQLVTAARSCGIQGPEVVRLSIYPMARTWGKELPPWARSWVRPEGCAVDLLRVPALNVWCGGRVTPHNVIEECGLSHRQTDEVWCLNALGHGQYGTSPAAKIWRASQQDLRIAHQYKLVPSWVISEPPERPAKKERKNANGIGVSGSASAPARKAGRGGAARSGGRGDGPDRDWLFPNPRK